MMTAVSSWHDDRQDDIVFLFFKLQNQLHPIELIADAKIDGCGGTEEVHRLSAAVRPGINIFKVKASFFLLKKYSHTLHIASHPHCLELPPDVRSATSRAFTNKFSGSAELILTKRGH